MTDSYIFSFDHSPFSSASHPMDDECEGDLYFLNLHLKQSSPLQINTQNANESVALSDLGGHSTDDSEEEISLEDIEQLMIIDMKRNHFSDEVTNITQNQLQTPEKPKQVVSEIEKKPKQASLMSFFKPKVQKDSLQKNNTQQINQNQITTASEHAENPNKSCPGSVSSILIIPELLRLEEEKFFETIKLKSSFKKKGEDGVEQRAELQERVQQQFMLDLREESLTPQSYDYKNTINDQIKSYPNHQNNLDSYQNNQDPLQQEFKINSEQQQSQSQEDQEQIKIQEDYDQIILQRKNQISQFFRDINFKL
eukprot:403357680